MPEVLEHGFRAVKPLAKLAVEKESFTARLTGLTIQNKSWPVDYYATVKFGRNRFSVPVELAGKQVTVKGTGLTVRIEYRGQVVAVHERSYARTRPIPA